MYKGEDFETNSKIIYITLVPSEHTYRLPEVGPFIIERLDDKIS